MQIVHTMQLTILIHFQWFSLSAKPSQKNGNFEINLEISNKIQHKAQIALLSFSYLIITNELKYRSNDGNKLFCL